MRVKKSTGMAGALPKLLETFNTLESICCKMHTVQITLGMHSPKQCKYIICMMQAKIPPNTDSIIFAIFSFFAAVLYTKEKIVSA